MKVKELIAKLLKLNKEAECLVSYNGPGGCETCGYGSEVERDFEIVDLETKIVFDTTR